MLVETKEALDYLHLMVNTKVDDAALQMACCRVLDDEAWQNGFGSSDKHHDYKGALPIHTAEVMKNALAMSCSGAHKSWPNYNVLIPAVIFHDFMKIGDYTEDGKPTDYKRLIYHIAGSYAEWAAACRDFNVDLKYWDSVGHCILAHHGRRDWKTVVEPQTLEAWILHFADMLSAGYGAGRVNPDEK